jgi:hypothetical protein
MYRITGDDTDYPTEDDARAAMREPFLGKNGTWQEDRSSDGSLKVSFVPADGRAKKQSWTIQTQKETAHA